MTFKNLHHQNHWANFNQLSKKHLWVKGIQVYTNEGPYPFPKEDNSEIGVDTLMKYKYILIYNHWGNFNQTLHRVSVGEGY